MVVVALLSGIPGGTALASEPPPLRIGILPYFSTRTLIATHQPLREHLQQGLERPVELHWCSDNSSWIRQTASGWVT